MQQIGLACLDHMSRNEAAVLAGIADGIHQMRVAVRRLRATLSGFGELLPNNQRHWASEELRWLADALGPARNLEVFETGLLEPAQQDFAKPLALKQLREAAQRRRRARIRSAETDCFLVTVPLPFLVNVRQVASPFSKRFCLPFLQAPAQDYRH